MVQEAQRTLKHYSDIKKLLVEIQRDESIVPSAEHNGQLEEAVSSILEFNRNCRRKKFAKKDEEENEEASEEEEEEKRYQRRDTTKKEKPVKKEKQPRTPK